MSTIALSALNQMDLLRALFLKSALRVPFLRGIFLDRSQRLLVLFLIMAFLNLFFAVLFPLQVLIVGPILYGLPHIFSSIRYMPYSIGDMGKIKTLQFLTLIFASVSIFRVLTDVGVLDISFLSSSTNTLELMAFAATVVGLGFITKKINVIGLILAALFVGLALVLPVWVTGVLILLHNFVAFAYWVVAAKTSREKLTAIMASVIFSVATLLIFLGAFDFAYTLFTPTASVPWADLDYSVLGKMIAPWSEDYVVWFHCVVAYAFGQSMHYFVWMKAIPDQHHDNQVPTSFNQSYKKLIADFGKKYVLMILVSLVALALVWIFVSHPLARIIYFALAAYHGYMEMAGLAFVRYERR